MKYLNKCYLKKIFLFQIFIYISITIILSRLFYFQIIRYSYFLKRSEKNFYRTTENLALRGNILDCNGKILATNKQILNIYWQGTGAKKLSQNQTNLINKLNIILETEGLKAINNKKIIKAEKLSQTILLTKNLKVSTLSKILELSSNNKNLKIKLNFKRFYPHKTTACHIIGYLQNSNKGQMGLEKILYEEINGQNEKILKKINSFGKEIDKEQLSPQINGKNISTTLNINYQNIAEQCFSNDLVGALILLEPSTGNIKTLISRPSFNSNIFTKKINKTDWTYILEKKPFINRAFEASYPPASIFKLITLAASLEKNLVNKDDKFKCKGFFKFNKKGRKYLCNNIYGHGELTLKESIAQSCNIPFFEIGKKISIDELSEYAKKFGLGEKKTLLFNEKAGIIPSTEWKLQAKGEVWQKGETVSASIGQSFLLTTPIQIACMIGAIFTGFLIKPKIIAEETEKIPLSLQQATLDFLKECMEEVIISGTGKQLKKTDLLKIYAKTGTAQTKTRSMLRNKTDDPLHAWFVSYFEYKNTTPLVLVILLENSKTKIAKKIAKNFVQKYIEMHKN